MMTGTRLWGGSLSREMLLIPFRERARVRGMGVAESMSTSTFSRASLSFSFDSTPKRCSSSTTIRPRSLKATSFWSIRAVPMSMSTLPEAVSSSTVRCSFFDENLERRATFTGNPVMRAVKDM